MAPGLNLATATPSQGSCSTASNTVSCDLGTLRSGGAALVLVTANAAGSPGPITNTATVSGDQKDPDPKDNTDSATVTVPPGAPVTGAPPPALQAFDLAVDKRASARQVRLRELVTYRIVVTNKGPAAAADVVLTDAVNGPVRGVRARASQGSCRRGSPFTCELGTIPAGGRVTIRVLVSHRRPGCQRNAASATGNGTDADPANGLDRVDVCVRKIPLRLTKVASRSTVRAGETFSYRIRVRNPTGGVARSVRVCDRLPSGVRFVSPAPSSRRDGRRRCWTIERLGARKSRTLRLSVRAALGASGRLLNRATATSSDARPARARTRLRVLRAAVHRLTMTAARGAAPAAAPRRASGENPDRSNGNRASPGEEVGCRHALCDSAAPRAHPDELVAPRPAQDAMVRLGAGAGARTGTPFVLRVSTRRGRPRRCA
jgi:uncharacterized repeat protein (TIGR01451 family)